MRGKNTKMLKRVFKDRQTYRRAKKAYNKSSQIEKLKAKEDIREILDTKKEIKNVR